MATSSRFSYIKAPPITELLKELRSVDPALAKELRDSLKKLAGPILTEAKSQAKADFDHLRIAETLKTKTRIQARRFELGVVGKEISVRNDKGKLVRGEATVDAEGKRKLGKIVKSTNMGYLARLLERGNAGKRSQVRHPLFGKKDKWFVQSAAKGNKVPSGYGHDTLVVKQRWVEQEIARILQDVVDKRVTTTDSEGAA